jgi:hypothetical protein
MRLRSIVLWSAFIGGALFPFVLSQFVGVAASVGLGLLAGAMAGISLYVVWGSEWEKQERSWRSGGYEDRMRSVALSGRYAFAGAAVYAGLVGLVLGAVWLADARRPAAHALLLFAPATLLVAAGVYSRWYARRISR